MKTLKVALISLRDVLVRKKLEKEPLVEAIKLLQFLAKSGVQIAMVSNSNWVMTDTQKPFTDFLQEAAGLKIPLHIKGVDFRAKQDSGAMADVLKKYGATPQEAVYIGSTDEDMQATRNSGVLFLNAKWYADNSPYGFEFASALDIARFIDCCCLRPKDWFWKHEFDGFRVLSIAPLAEVSKRYPEGAKYSTDAKAAAKFSRGDLRYWGLLMASRIHFSGIGAEVDYVCPYPGHRTDSPKGLLTNALKIVAGSLKAQYLDDLLVRHASAEKSQAIRNSGRQPTPENQLKTTRLRKDPVRTGKLALRYKSPPLRAGKKVLIVDDICTQGHSFEAARLFVQSTGADAIGISWLKTPGNDYSRVSFVDPAIKSPYLPYSPVKVRTIPHSFNAGIVNNLAAQEIGDAFQAYGTWVWPT
ncbi:HAD family hydrolase [Paracoccus denitrificans]|jgi:predicted amidophosphoribosyltransferase|uniref:Uncharacterized protein n=1 Tax=Paracoccus denitrificans (strain Pd 1222) TaxID=318586 RepID=A1B6R5_PARDP|nr:HAD family hydrolase [Paracoccus denitrificans]ABL71209.1 conserved hypothetical protein [Paracoccus denitrificans PD1222]MBB4628188.1 putative amidophosphoribosyltransferase [Paracoccus denitrificans]MCU7429252.1 hypothetical protein [Paracoccus denitrificans]QAR27849.1 HAD family hydrolase [Paracoccus denitrificans]UPV97561.1 hypothetical protein M0K93_16000 [Paracoccus denitrificans]